MSVTTLTVQDVGRIGRVRERVVNGFSRLMPELSTYTLASVTALIVDLGIFNALLFGGMRAAMAGLAGYTVGLFVHFALSRRYVFKTLTAGKTDLRRFCEFALSGCVGLGLTWLVIQLATDVLHLPAVIGKIAAVGSSFIVVFALRRGIVFAGRARR